MTKRGVRKRLTGLVIGNKMDKTAMISVNRLKKHNTYMKYVRSHSKYMAHDPQNLCHVGDTVKIIETRPMSKHKRWQVLEITKESATRETANQDQSSEQVK